MSAKIEAKDCSGVVVTFFPDVDFEKKFSLICQEIKNVVIVDNSAAQDVHIRLEDIVKTHNATLIKNTRNLGIGEALNQGVEHSKQIDAKWLFCFDQDSQIRPGFFDIMSRAVSFQKNRYFLLGCNYIDAKTHKPRIPLCEQGFLCEPIERKTVITSGMLVPMALVELIGVFRADYFIDSVDHEYCLRARRNKYPVLMTREVGMSHLIGAKQAGSNYFTTLVPRHNPTRKYYMTRNALLTTKEYWTTEKVWGCKQIVRILVEMCSIILFEDDKQKKLNAMLKGFRDAVKQKTGSP